MNLREVLRGRLAMARAELFTLNNGRWRARSGLVAVTLTLGLSALLAYAFALGFRTLAKEGITAAEAGPVLAAIFGATMIGTLLLDLHATMATLLLAPDLELLRRAPIRTRAVLGLKLLDALPLSSTMVLGLALPATTGFALAYSGAMHAALAPLVIAALWGLPLGLGVVAASALVRLAPASRVREAIGMLTTVGVALLWLANTFLLPRYSNEYPVLQDSLRAAIAHLPTPHAASPVAWAVESLIAPWPRALAALAMLVSAAAGSLALATVVGARALKGASIPFRDARTAPRRSAIPFTNSLAAAFLRRDLALYLRDWTVMSDVLVGALLWTLLPLAFIPVVPMEPRTLAHTILVSMSVGLGHLVAARALPFERDGLAWAGLAPLAPIRWVLARLPGVLVIVLPMFLTAWLVSSVTLRLQATAAIQVLVWASATLATAIGIGVWTGAAFGDPAWTHPRAMLRWTGRLVAIALLVVQASVWLALGPLLDRIPVVMGGCLVLLASAVSTSIALHGASRRLARPRGPWG